MVRMNVKIQTCPMLEQNLTSYEPMKSTAGPYANEKL